VCSSDLSYEVMLVGSYGMVMVGAGKAQVRQTMKYIAINAIGSTFFVVGVGLIYATCGTTNMAELAVRTAALEGDKAALVTVVSTVLLVVFAMKTAAFPLFFWLPDTYPVVPAGVNGYFAGLLTKVGVYSLLRVFVMVFQQDGREIALNILLVLSAFTMFFGVMGAMCQWDIRKILSWHIISQVGYMVMGIGLCGAADERVVTLAIVGTIPVLLIVTFFLGLDAVVKLLAVPFGAEAPAALIVAAPFLVIALGLGWMGARRMALSNLEPWRTWRQVKRDVREVTRAGA